MQKLITKDGVQTYELESWDDFFDLIADPFAKSPAYIYRGQADWEWDLTSSFYRHKMKFPLRKNLLDGEPEFFDCPPLSEEHHLNAFRRAIRGRRGPNPTELDSDACWALGQHYGLATPLMDWTRAPFIALFFAFDEERVCTGESFVEPENRVVYALSTSIFCDENDGDQILKVVSPTSDDNFRLINQSALLVKPISNTDLESAIREKFKGDSRSILTKVKIPNNCRNDCLVALNKMGINHMTMFPDIGGAARHVNSLWEPGHDDSIAYV